MKLANTNHTIFLDVPRDVQKEFAKAYAALSPMVKVISVDSSGDLTQRVDGVIIDKSTGKQAMSYDVRVNSLQGADAHASGGGMASSMAGSVWIYTLHLEDGKWRVVGKEQGPVF